MKVKAVIPIAIILALLALALAACGPDIEERPTATTEAPEIEEATTTTAGSSQPEGDTITTESGLQYTQIEPGDGPAPEPGDVVTIHYRANFEDGTELSNSYDSGQPISFALGQSMVIQGWDEGVALMTEGEKAQLVVPPALAFGESGTDDGVIPPNSTMIFEIELVSVQAGAPDAPTTPDDADYTTTESGLKYYDFVVGEGATPETGQIVTVHYTGWLEDGTKFDSSLDRAEPFTFKIGMNQVIAGWDEGVATMQVGGKRQLVIPPDLGYGEQGAGTSIPANATLTFEVELISIQEGSPDNPATVEEEDYVTTESGLKYTDFVVGDGASPEAGQSVTVHYTGWLEDGTKFDSSLDRGQPFTFQIGMGQVIAGWDEGVSTMKVGGKRQLVIPPDLGYGEQGAGNIIPANATLVFEVELLGVQ